MLQNRNVKKGRGAVFANVMIVMVHRREKGRERGIDKTLLECPESKKVLFKNVRTKNTKYSPCILFRVYCTEERKRQTLTETNMDVISRFLNYYDCDSKH